MHNDIVTTEKLVDHNSYNSSIVIKLPIYYTMHTIKTIAGKTLSVA